jgi:hypothetical protein
MMRVRCYMDPKVRPVCAFDETLSTMAEMADSVVARGAA